MERGKHLPFSPSKPQASPEGKQLHLREQVKRKEHGGEDEVEKEPVWHILSHTGEKVDTWHHWHNSMEGTNLFT